MTTCAVCGYKVGHTPWCCYRQSQPGGTPNRPPDSLEVKAVLRGAAAEAAQSPQVGAALAALRELFKAVEDGVLVRNTARDAEPGYSIRAMDLVMILRRAQDALAEPGRSVSDRPPAAVASADPELAARDAEWREALLQYEGCAYWIAAEQHSCAKCAPLRALLSEGK